MVSFDTAATLTLVVILTLIVLFNRNKLTFQKALGGIFYVAMYRTKAGITTMDKIATRWKPFFEKAAPWIIGLGFLGMAVVTIDLARSLISVLIGTTTPTVGVVLPVKAKGVFYVPFLYWFISIFVILIVHEGMHGVMARVYNLPVKNSGLVVLGALLPIIPGAFVEPDEKKLLAADRKKQLAVYAAGPCANIVLAFLLFLFSFSVLTPLTDTFYSKDGVVITELMDGNPPAETAGLGVGEKIQFIDGSAISVPEDFSTAISEKQPGDTINLVTAGSVYDIQLGENPKTGKAWLGVYVEQPVENPTIFTSALIWIKELFFWLFVLNLGVGLFNLVPLGPIDGGRMFLTAMQKYTHERRANAVWKSVSVGVLCILLTNVVLAFI